MPPDAPPHGAAGALRRGVPARLKPRRAEPFVPAYVEDRPGGCTLAVRVIPRAKRTEVVGARANALLVKLTAPPVEGAANEALVAFLAGRLGVPKRALMLVSGTRSREKRVAIDGVSAAEVARRLGLEG